MFDPSSPFVIEAQRHSNWMSRQANKAAMARALAIGESSCKTDSGLLIVSVTYDAGRVTELWILNPDKPELRTVITLESAIELIATRARRISRES